MTTKIKRFIAGVLGAAIILALLLIVDEVHGDPLSEYIGKRRAIAYAQECYPGQTFHVMENSDPMGRFRETDIWVQSDQSRDTYFGVTTRFWMLTEDWQGAPRQRMVDGRENTRGRMEREAGEEIAALFKEQLPDLRFSWANFRGNDAVMVNLGWEDGESISETSLKIQKLPLDQPFTPEIVQRVPSRISVSLLWDTAPTEEDLEVVLHRLKTTLEQNGMPFCFYDVELKPANEENFERMLSGSLYSQNRPASEIE